MLCPKCGAQLSDDARFCNNCGSTVASANPWQAANDLGAEAAPRQNPYGYPQNSYDPNPYPQNTYDPSVYPTGGAAPKKSKKLWFIIGGAVAVVAVVAVVLILVLGGSTPTSVVEDYYEANFNNDFVARNECFGIDYKESRRIYYDEKDLDVDDLVDEWLDEDEWYDGENKLEDYCNDYDLDYDKWESKLDDVEDIDDYIDFLIDFYKAYQKAYNKEYERSYEIKKIEEEELSGSDLEDAEDRFESWYDYYEDDCEDALLFDEDDVKGYYLVTGKIRREHDGEKETERFSMLVVDTSEGCFIIDTDWEPED